MIGAARRQSTRPARLIIRHGRVLDTDDNTAPHKDILVIGGIIREIGPPEIPTPEDAQIFDASDRLIIPGLINAHTHGDVTLARGAGDRWNLELLLNAVAAGGHDIGIEGKYIAAALGAAEMVLRGCTACYDLYSEFPVPTVDGLTAVAQAYADVGMRAVIAPLMADHSFWHAIPSLVDALPAGLQKEISRFNRVPSDPNLEVIRAALAGWRFEPLCQRLALAPTIPHHCEDAFLVACRDFAAEADLSIQTHLGESKLQALVGVKKYGETLTAHLDGLGVLGPNFTAAHAVWLDDDDMQRLADRGCSVAHNPTSNLRLGTGVAPIAPLRSRGVAVGVGTDGCTCSDHLNMFEAQRLACGLSRICSLDPHEWLSARDAFSMATSGSARALGFGDCLGGISVGALADLVFLDLDDPAYVPLRNPLQQIVFSETSSSVASVMIDGRLIVDGGRLLTVDRAALRNATDRLIETLAARDAAGTELAARLEPIVGAFCVGLMHAPYATNRLFQE